MGRVLRSEPPDANAKLTASHGLDLQPSYGATERFEGRCEIDAVAGSKRFQGVWLVLDNDTRYIVAYRVTPEYLPFADKRVVVQGRLYTPGQDTQHIVATHLAVEAIALAPGETPWQVAPTTPPAPTVRSGAELAERDGRWVQLVAKLCGIEVEDGGSTGRAKLRLADGTCVTAIDAPLSRWKSLVGQWVSVTSRVVSVEGGRFRLCGTHTIRVATSSEPANI